MEGRAFLFPAEVYERDFVRAPTVREQWGQRKEKISEVRRLIRLRSIVTC